MSFEKRFKRRNGFVVSEIHRAGVPKFGGFNSKSSAAFCNVGVITGAPSEDLSGWEGTYQVKMSEMHFGVILKILQLKGSECTIRRKPQILVQPQQCPCPK